MAMMGGLECIAMAVEHLERSESISAPPTTALVTSAVPFPSTQHPHPHQPLPPAHLPTNPSHCSTTSMAQVVVPHQTSFVQQPRLVSDAEDVVEKDMEDAQGIEELRKLIFEIDLSEWKTTPVIDLKQVITTVTSHDVLCGRGGETNHHKGMYL